MNENTKFIIDTMEWSYSRLTAYNQCPYQFKLKYVECNEGEPNFYAQYGSFCHKILEKYAIISSKSIELNPIRNEEYNLGNFLKNFKSTDDFYGGKYCFIKYPLSWH